MTSYPPTRADAVVDTIHGVPVRDPYRWLEDEQSAEVQTWMRAQDELTRAELARLPGLEHLRARLRELFYYDAISAPAHRQGRFFYTRKHADREKAIVSAAIAYLAYHGGDEEFVDEIGD